MEEWLDRVFTKADYDMTIVCHIERNDMAIYANPQYYFRFDDAEYRGLIESAAAAATPARAPTTCAPLHACFLNAPPVTGCG